MKSVLFFLAISTLKCVFNDYMTPTWIEDSLLSRKPLFDIQLWNHFDVDGPRTNNYVEGKNLFYKKKFDSHPNLWKFIEIVKNLETVQGVRYEKLKRDVLKERNRDNEALKRDLEIIKEKNRYLQAIQGASESEELISLIELLEKLAANVPEFEK